MNQARDATRPTWVVGIEGRFDVSEPMHACNTSRTALNVNEQLDPTVPQKECAEIGDINRNGIGGEYPAEVDRGSLEGSFSGGRKPGVSRGVLRRPRRPPPRRTE